MPPRSASRLIPSEITKMIAVSVMPTGRGTAHLPALERAREDLVGRHRRRVAGPATGRDVDEVEVAQRGVVVSVSATAISPRSAGSVTAKNSRNAPAPSTRAASYRDDGIFCTPAREQHHRQPEVDPRADQPDRRQRQVEVPEPRLALDAEPAQEAVQRPVLGVVDHLPHDRDDDQRDHLRQEQDRAEERQPAHARARHHARQQQPDQQRQQRVEDQQDRARARTRCAAPRRRRPRRSCRGPPTSPTSARPSPRARSAPRCASGYRTNAVKTANAGSR